MTTTAPAPAQHRRTSRAAEVLCGDGRTDLVRAAVGLDPERALSVRVDRVQHRTDGTSVGYEVRYPADAASSAEIADYVVASTAPLALAADGVARLHDGELDVALWRHPGDPALPGLAPACDLPTVASWLPGTERLEVVTYRPLRRAVVRASGPEGVTGYLKVVRPHAAAALVRRHRATGALGSPRVLAEPVPGVLVLAEVAGPTLAEAVALGHRAPSLDELEALLDRIDDSCTRERAATAFALDLPAQLAALGALEGVLSPDVDARLHRLAATVLHQVEATDRGWPTVATHGDLHPANLVVAPPAPGDPADPVTVVGVLDVDRVGPGHRVDDLACLLGHASVAAVGPTAGAPAARATLERWWASVADPAPLAARTASVVLALTGVVDPAAVPALLDLAGSWSARVSTPNAPLTRGAGSTPTKESS